MSYEGKVKSISEAVLFMREHGIRRLKDWSAFCEREGKPEDIPLTLNVYYKEHFPEEWMGTRRFFGTEKGGKFFKELDWKHGSSQKRVWRPFNEAREFVRGLKLLGTKGWQEYSRSGKLPKDIPKAPNGIYRDEWKGIWDWLGRICVVFVGRMLVGMGTGMYILV